MGVDPVRHVVPFPDINTRTGILGAIAVTPEDIDTGLLDIPVLQGGSPLITREGDPCARPVHVLDDT